MLHPQLRSQKFFVIHYIRIAPFTGNNLVPKCAFPQGSSEILYDPDRGPSYKDEIRPSTYDAQRAMTENENGTNYNINDFADVEGLSRDRPWLLPSVSMLVCIDILRVGALAEIVISVLRTESCDIYRGFRCAT